MTWIHPRERRRLAAKAKKPPLFTNKTWQACYVDFMAHLKTRNPVADTGRQYDYYLRQFFTDPSVTPDRYLKSDVEHFLARLDHRGDIPAPTLRNAKLIALSSFYNYASTYEIRFRNTIKPLMARQPPTRGVRAATVANRSRAMTDDELARIFTAITESKGDPVRKLRDRALFKCYLCSGRRRREILGIRWRDLEQVKIYQRGQLVDAWVYHWRGKGHLEVDDATQMPDDAMEPLIEYLKAAGRWGNMAPDDLLFPGREAGRSIHPSYANTIFREYARAAGLKETGIHRFRHTAARARYELHHDIEKVQKFLRHRHIESTMIYIQSDQYAADDDAQRLHDRFGRL